MQRTGGAMAEVCFGRACRIAETPRRCLGLGGRGNVPWDESGVIREWEVAHPAGCEDFRWSEALRQQGYGGQATPSLATGER